MDLRTFLHVSLIAVLEWNLVAPAWSAERSAAGTKAANGRATASAAPAKPGFRPMRIQVKDGDGKPIADAEVKAVFSNLGVPDLLNHRRDADGTYRTNADGIAAVQVPKDESDEVSLLVSARGYVTALAQWRTALVRESVPAQFTIALETGTRIGGIVRDEQGRPIAGAEVTVLGLEASLLRRRSVAIQETAKTDAEGRWQCQGIPSTLQGLSAGIHAQHPDYVSSAGVGIDDSSIGGLRAKTAVIVLRKGIVVEGAVTDPKGKPVIGADVGKFAPEGREAVTRAKTDLRGRYHLPSLPGQYVFAAAASGYAPCSRQVAVAGNRMTVDFQLGEGEPFRFRVVDPEQEPLSGVSVGFIVPKDKPEFVSSHLPSVTDAEGRWKGKWIPKEQLTFHFTKPGFLHVVEAVAPGGQEQTITMKRDKGWTVVGRVVDHETKTPVTRFEIVEGSVWGDEMARGGKHAHWSDRRLVEDDRGEYHATCGYVSAEHPVVRIEADGYFPSETRHLTANERRATFDVELTKGQNISGVVQSPDGKPLDGAVVALATTARGLHMIDNFPATSMAGQPALMGTGPDGRFSFLPQREPCILLALHEHGYAWAEGGVGLKEIRVQPWARLIGTVRVGNRPIAEDTVSLDSLSVALPRPNRRNRLSAKDAGVWKNIFGHRLSMNYSAKTDAKGQYVFDRVPAGKATLYRHLTLTQEGSTTTYAGTQTTPIELVQGQTLKIDLGGNGRPVAGRVVLAEKKENVKISGQTVRADRPPTRDNLTTVYTARLKPNGSFRFDELPSSKYRLSVELSERDAADGFCIALIEHEFIVPDMPGGRSNLPLDLGILRLTPPDRR